MEQKKRQQDELDALLLELCKVISVQDSLIYIFERIEESYGDADGQEAKMVAGCAKMYAETVREKLTKMLDRVDNLMV